MTLRSYLSQLSANNRDAVIVTSLGNISSEMKTIDHFDKILVKGAMGCAIAVGLGYALGTKQDVYVVIGEGSFLMKMGSMALVEKLKLKNLHITIVNNGKFDSCGGQENYFSTVKRWIPYEIFTPTLS